MMTPADRQLLEELYRQYFKKLYLYASAVLREPGQAEDVVQDTFHEGLRHMDMLARHPNPGGWLMNTMKYKLKEYQRAQRRDLRRLLCLEAAFSDESRLPEALVAAEPELREEVVLERVQGALTPEEYHLLKRLVFDRASHLDVARELGISVYASQKRLERIRDKLHAVFPDRRRPRKEGEKTCEVLSETSLCGHIKEKGGLPWRKTGRNTPT